MLQLDVGFESAPPPELDESEKVELVTMLSDPPSVLLSDAASELERAADAHEVHVLEHGLQKLQHEMGQLWTAAKRLVAVLGLEPPRMK